MFTSSSVVLMIIIHNILDPRLYFILGSYMYSTRIKDIQYIGCGCDDIPPRYWLLMITIEDTLYFRIIIWIADDNHPEYHPQLYYNILDSYMYSVQGYTVHYSDARIYSKLEGASSILELNVTDYWMITLKDTSNVRVRICKCWWKPCIILQIYVTISLVAMHMQ